MIKVYVTFILFVIAVIAAIIYGFIHKPKSNLPDIPNIPIDGVLNDTTTYSNPNITKTIGSFNKSYYSLTPNNDI